MKLSTRKLRANRANAQKSTGPKTEEGKSKSSKNATRHAIYSQAVVLDSEDKKLYDIVFQANLEAYVPVMAEHWLLIADITATEWRLRRAEIYETRILNQAEQKLGSENSDQILKETQSQLEFITKYQRSLHRNVINLQREYEFVTKRWMSATEAEKKNAEKIMMAFRDMSLNKPTPESLAENQKVVAHYENRYEGEMNGEYAPTATKPPREKAATPKVEKIEPALVEITDQKNWETNPDDLDALMEEALQGIKNFGFELQQFGDIEGMQDKLINMVKDGESLLARMSEFEKHPEKFEL